MIHGLLMNRRMFDRLAPEMAARGNRVITIDLLGHGRSDRPPQMVHYSMTFFARQVEALLDHLEIDRAVIGGTSLGANTTLETAYLAPDRVRNDGRDAVLDNALLAARGDLHPDHARSSLRRALRSRSSLRSLAECRGRTSCSTSARLAAPGPRASSAVLEGLFLGSAAPHHDFRVQMTQPTLVIGHHADPLHPFSIRGCSARSSRTPAWSRRTRSSSGGSPRIGSTTSSPPSSTTSGRANRRPIAAISSAALSGGTAPLASPRDVEPTEEKERLRAERLAAERAASSSARRRLFAGYLVAGLLGAAVVAGLVVVIASGGDGGASADACEEAHIQNGGASAD